MIRLAVVGDRNTDHRTHRAIDASLALLPSTVINAEWIASDAAGLTAIVEDLDGVWIGPGSPYRDDEAVLGAIRTAREQGIPLVGT